MDKKQVFSEVYAVLTALGDKYIQKTPIEILNFIADNRDYNYNIEINKNEALEKQNLSKETIAILAMLKLDYWCNTKEEKAELCAILEMNDQKEKGEELSTASKEAWINLLKEKYSKPD